jgi:hypothetical protein
MQALWCLLINCLREKPAGHEPIAEHSFLFFDGL